MAEIVADDNNYNVSYNDNQISTRKVNSKDEITILTHDGRNQSAQPGDTFKRVKARSVGLKIGNNEYKVVRNAVFHPEDSLEMSGPDTSNVVTVRGAGEAARYRLIANMDED